jgi:hypothetical protein
MLKHSLDLGWGTTEVGLVSYLMRLIFPTI